MMPNGHDATEDTPSTFTFGHLLGLRAMEALTSQLVEGQKRQNLLNEQNANMVKSMDGKTDAILETLKEVKTRNEENRKDIDSIKKVHTSAKALWAAAAVIGLIFGFMVQLGSLISSWLHHK